MAPVWFRVVLVFPDGCIPVPDAVAVPVPGKLAALAGTMDAPAELVPERRHRGCGLVWLLPAREPGYSGTGNFPAARFLWLAHFSRLLPYPAALLV